MVEKEFQCSLYVSYYKESIGSYAKEKVEKTFPYSVDCSSYRDAASSLLNFIGAPEHIVSDGKFEPTFSKHGKLYKLASFANSFNGSRIYVKSCIGVCEQ